MVECLKRQEEGSEMAIKLDERPAPAPLDLLAAARRRFMQGERLDISGLAEELGVSRATAYRWAGNVEDLTGSVVASLAADTFKLALAEAEGAGIDRLIDMIRRGMRYMSTGPYRVWLEREEPETALRIVASRFGPAQRTMIRLWEELLAEELRCGNLELPVDPHSMAYALVRLGESFLYADLIAGEDPDVDKAVEIYKLLLR
jgi:AcrR family transcriptional regulator